jgi:HSP20 family protein
MPVIRWNNPQELGLRNEFDSLFDGIFRGDLSRTASAFAPAWLPAVDIAETGNDFTVRMELPGVGKDDVTITLEDAILTVKGEKKQEKGSKESGYRRVERSYGSFHRSFSLPSAVRTEGVDASFSEGVLTITLPKAEEAKPKQIIITVK